MTRATTLSHPPGRADGDRMVPVLPVRRDGGYTALLLLQRRLGIAPDSGGTQSAMAAGSASTLTDEARVELAAACVRLAARACGSPPSATKAEIDRIAALDASEVEAAHKAYEAAVSTWSVGSLSQHAVRAALLTATGAGDFYRRHGVSRYMPEFSTRD